MLQSMESQRAGHNLAAEQCNNTSIDESRKHDATERSQTREISYYIVPFILKIQDR